MSKVKQWAEDTAEKSVDKILLQVKQNLITKETATTDILNVENVNMLGINADNVDEVISENAQWVLLKKLWQLFLLCSE